MRKSRTWKLAIWLSQQAKGIANKGASNNSSEDCLKLPLNIGSQGFHNSQEERSIISGLVFATEEGAFQELEDAVEGPAKVEMGDDAAKEPMKILKNEMRVLANWIVH